MNADNTSSRVVGRIRIGADDAAKKNECVGDIMRFEQGHDRLSHPVLCILSKGEVDWSGAGVQRLCGKQARLLVRCESARDKQYKDATVLFGTAAAVIKVQVVRRR